MAQLLGKISIFHCSSSGLDLGLLGRAQGLVKVAGQMNIPNMGKDSQKSLCMFCVILTIQREAVQEIVFQQKLCILKESSSTVDTLPYLSI